MYSMMMMVMTRMVSSFLYSRKVEGGKAWGWLLGIFSTLGCSHKLVWSAQFPQSSM